MKTLLAKIERQRLFLPGETVLVAVSGGADSVALLDLLVHLESKGLKLVVAHLNHQLRGDASDGDEEFVRSLAEGYGLPFVSRGVDVASFARDSRLSLEDAGRRARYSFFEEAAGEHGATSIALAHHQDDQAETVLMRLLRGAGGSGLSGMAGSSGGMLKRPLLQVSRGEIEQYLKRRGLSHRTDESNADTAILRNSIRHELIPFLRRYNPNVSERLAATAEILASDEELLEEMTTAAYARAVEAAAEDAAEVQAGAAEAQGGIGRVRLKIETVACEPRGLRLRLYRRALLELRGDLQRISLVHLEAIDRLLLSSHPSGKLKLPGDCFITRSYRELIMQRAEESAGPSWELPVEGEGSHLLPDGSVMLVERVPRPTRLDGDHPRVAWLGVENNPFPWVVRTFQRGDRMQPLGMRGVQKVKDLFINEKIPIKERCRIPILSSGGRIVWVAGLRLSEEARVPAEAREALRVEIRHF